MHSRCISGASPVHHGVRARILCGVRPALTAQNNAQTPAPGRTRPQHRTVADTVRRAKNPTNTLSGSLIALLLVLAALTFNPALAFLNAQGLGLSSRHVMAAEFAIFAGAHAYILWRFRPDMLRWYALCALLTAVAIMRIVGTGDIDPKFLRDTLIIPTFIMLGLTVAPGKMLDRFVVFAAGFITLIMLWEAYFVEHYIATFRVADFYVATRGVAEAEFERRGTELAFSAIRWAGRNFAFVDWHRLSSVFLEALSLGNACMIFAAYLFARWPRMGVWLRLVLALLIVVLLVGSDGRRAAAVLVMTVPIMLIAPRLPARIPVLYLPAALVAVFGLVSVFGFTSGSDDLPGRIAVTVEMSTALSALDWAGLATAEFVDSIADSGWIYLIATHSIFGLFALWGWIVFGSRADTPGQVRMLHATALYLASGMMVTVGFLTIKTAALLWFLFGTLQNDTEGSRRHR